MTNSNHDGPFDDERQVRELPAVRAIHEAFRADPGVGKMAPHVREMLEAACLECGVALGTFDNRVISWLSGWEPETAAAIAGWIVRAHDKGFADGETAHPGQMPGGGWISGSGRP